MSNTADLDVFETHPSSDIDWADIDWDTIPGLESVKTASAQPKSPSHYSLNSLDFEIDDAFLAEIDALEKQAFADLAYNDSDAGPSNASSDHTSAVALRSQYFTGPSSAQPTASTAPSSPKLRPSPRQSRIPDVGSTSEKRHTSSSSSLGMRKRGKRNTDLEAKVNGDDIRLVLDGLEDEMTCPICCDLFAAAHLGNPCGHTFCGECGWNWVSRNTLAPTCACCRAQLDRTTPMIPNIAVDNTVDRHVRALAASGNAEWQDGGHKLEEWQKRKESWKKIARQRRPASRTLPDRTYVVEHLDDMLQLYMDTPASDRPQTRRNRRRRARSSSGRGRH